MVSVRHTFSCKLFQERYLDDDPPELYSVQSEFKSQVGATAPRAGACCAQSDQQQQQQQQQPLIGLDSRWRVPQSDRQTPKFKH